MKLLRWAHGLSVVCISESPLTCRPLLSLFGVWGTHLISLGEGFQTKHAPLPIPIWQYLFNKQNSHFINKISLLCALFFSLLTYVVTCLKCTGVRRKKMVNSLGKGCFWSILNDQTIFDHRLLPIIKHDFRMIACFPLEQHMVQCVVLLSKKITDLDQTFGRHYSCGIDGLIIDSAFLSKASITGEVTTTRLQLFFYRLHIQNRSLTRVRPANWVHLSSVRFVKKFVCDTRQHSVSNCCAFQKLDVPNLFGLWHINMKLGTVWNLLGVGSSRKGGGLHVFFSLQKGG